MESSVAKIPFETDSFRQVLQPIVVCAGCASAIDSICDLLADRGLSESMKADLRIRGSELLRELAESRAVLVRYWAALGRLETILWGLGAPEWRTTPASGTGATESDDSGGGGGQGV